MSMLLILVAGVAGRMNLTLASGVIEPGYMISLARTSRAMSVNVRQVRVSRWMTPMLYTSRPDRLSLCLHGSHFHSFLTSPVVLDRAYPERLEGQKLDNTWAQAMIADKRAARSMTIVDCSFIKCQTKVEDGGSGYGRSGGALFLGDDKSQSSIVTIESSNFTQCYARVGGGAIFASEIKSLSITGCIFEKCVNDKETGGALFCYKVNTVIIEFANFTGNEDKSIYAGIISLDTCANTDLSHMLINSSIFSNANRQNAADINIQMEENPQSDWKPVKLTCVNFINPKVSNAYYLFFSGTKGWFHLTDCYFDKKTYSQAVATQGVFAVSTNGIHENEYNDQCILDLTPFFTSEDTFTTAEGEIFTTTDEGTTEEPTSEETTTDEATTEQTSIEETTEEEETQIIATKGITEAPPPAANKLSIEIIAVIAACSVLVIIVIIVVIVVVTRGRRRTAFREPNPDPMDEGAFNVPFD